MKSRRVLIIDEKARARVREVLGFSLREENWCEPAISPPLPEDDPRHVASLDTCRCVFNITRTPGGQRFRHLWVSIFGGHYLTPFALYTIAQEFGFTGWDGKNINAPKDWSIDINRKKGRAVAIQPF